MNSIEIGNKIAEAVANRPPQLGKKYQILYLNGRIWCHPLGKPIPNSHALALFTDADLDQGFTPKQWDEITRTVLTLLKSEERMKQDAENPQNNNDRRGGEAPLPNTA